MTSPATRSRLALGFSLFFVLVVVAAVLLLIRPRPAPHLPAFAWPETRRASANLLLVVVDGLRYDVATDPRRMPRFAEAMQRRRSAELWTGRITMTSSGVLAIGTGQSGGLEDVVRDMAPRPAEYDNWPAGAARRGITIAAVGDPAWHEVYGASLAFVHDDPVHLAVDVDFSDETFAAVHEAMSHAPDVCIAHFVVPDHQGHAWGIVSENYERYIRAYDARLAGLLSEFGPEWTVIVTSDHGAADSGTHGTDIDVERRVPIYAYGPGIAPPASRSGAVERLEQVDLANTIAALLGVAPPAHSVGRVAVDWLDVPPAERAAIARADAARARTYDTSARNRVAPIVSSLLLLAAVLAFALGAVRLVVPEANGRLVQTAMALGGVAVAFVWGLERLPGEWPAVARASVATVANAAIVPALLLPRRTLAWFERFGPSAALVLPGLLVVTFPLETRIEVFVLLFAGAMLLAQRPIAAVIVPAVLLLLFAMPDVYRELSVVHPLPARAVAVAAVVVWLAVRTRHSAADADRDGGAYWPLVAAALVIGAILARPIATAVVGRASMLALGLVGAAAAWTRRPRVALDLALASFAWVGRDFEIPGLLLVLAIADRLGSTIALDRDERRATPASQLVLVTLAVALLFVQRLILQGSVDFGGLDWRAAGFDDPRTPVWLLTGALIWKHSIGAALTLGWLALGCRRADREPMLRGVLLAECVRTVALFAMLVPGSTSFWTGLLVVSDLPHPLIAVVVAAAIWAAVASPRPASVVGSPV